MQAIVYDNYGSADMLQLREIERPALTDNGILVRVRAASVNPADWHVMRGEPRVMRLQFGLRRPKQQVLGFDMAGQVEAVGKDVTRFRPGDAVYGEIDGAFAEHACVDEKLLSLKPSNLTFEQAAAVPMAGVTALQALRDKGQVQAGQRVLVNGASGGVGTFAVQIAQGLGAEVTAVCSTRNVEAMRSIGAARVIDYTVEDFTRTDERYHVMLDNVGNRSLSECRRVLVPNGKLVVVGGPRGGPWLGPIPHLLGTVVRSLVVRRLKVIAFVAKRSAADLQALREMIEETKVSPVIDRHYPLNEAAAAIRYLEEGHAQGKVVITLP